MSYLKFVNRLNTSEHVRLLGIISMIAVTGLLAASLHGHAWFDSAHGLPEAQMIFLGFVPYRDFFLQTTPFSYLVTAATFFSGKPIAALMLIQTSLISLTPLLVLLIGYKLRLSLTKTAFVWVIAMGLMSGMLDGLFHQNTYTVYAECLTFVLLVLVFFFFVTSNAWFYRSAALCWGVLFTTHQYYALFTSPLVFWPILAALRDELPVRERVYCAVLAAAPVVVLLAWVLRYGAMESMIDDLVVSAFENVNKDLDPSIGGWFVTITEPLGYLASGNITSLIKSRGLVVLWLWAFCAFVVAHLWSARQEKARLTLRDHILISAVLVAVLSLLIVSRHYGGNRILTLLSPEFIFLILGVAIAGRAGYALPSWEKTVLRVAFFALFFSGVLTVMADRKNLFAFFDSGRWSTYTTLRGESLLIDPPHAAKFNAAIRAIDSHRGCLSLQKVRGTDRMIILGRGNQIYYAVNAIPYLPYVFLEDTLLGPRRFESVLARLKELQPKCLVIFTYGRYNSEWERTFQSAVSAWVNERYEKMYDKDEVYIFALLPAAPYPSLPHTTTTR